MALKTTPREKQVIGLLLRGYDNATIAKELGMEVGTVKTCLNKLFLKFQIDEGMKRVKLAMLLYEGGHLKFADRRPRFRERQKRIVEFVASGMKNAQIAEAIGTTEQTVKNSLHVIYDELGLWSRVEVALWYEARRRSRQAVASGWDVEFDKLRALSTAERRVNAARKHGLPEGERNEEPKLRWARPKSR